MFSFQCIFPLLILIPTAITCMLSLWYHTLKTIFHKVKQDLQAKFCHSNVNSEMKYVCKGSEKRDPNFCLMLAPKQALMEFPWHFQKAIPHGEVYVPLHGKLLPDITMFKSIAFLVSYILSKHAKLKFPFTLYNFFSPACFFQANIFFLYIPVNSYIIRNSSDLRATYLPLTQLLFFWAFASSMLLQQSAEFSAFIYQCAHQHFCLALNSFKMLIKSQLLLQLLNIKFMIKI